MKTRYAMTATFTLLSSLLLAGSASAQATPSHLMVKANDLQWNSVPSLPPGARLAVMEGPMNEAKPFTARLELPANYRIPPHSHPAIEHVTVISGAFLVGMGDKFDEQKVEEMPAGAFAVMQPGVVHYGMTKVPTVIQIHGVGPWAVKWANPADDPSKK